MSLQPSDISNSPKKSELGIRLLFLLVFVLLGVYLRAKAMSAPIYPFMYRFDILPHLNSSFFDLILSEHHRTIQIYRNAFSILFINGFGLNDYTPRIFSVVVAFCTFWFMYRFTKHYIGPNEAVISVLLIGVSYSSLHGVMRPQYGGFYMFASVWTVWALFKAYETGRKSYWWIFVLANFLNITNCIIAFVFTPALIGLAFLFWSFKDFFGNDLLERNQRNKKMRSFIVCFVISIILSLTLYAARSLNIPLRAFNLIFYQQVEKELASDDVDQFDRSNSYAKILKKLTYEFFVALNYEYRDYVPAKEIKEELNSRLWIYPSFFLLGLVVLFRKKRPFFWCFIAIFSLPIITSVFGLKMGEGRYLWGVLPFYLIVVACGATYLFSFLNRWVSNKFLNQILTFGSVFLIFSWFVHPSPIWSDQLKDGMFQMNGSRSTSQYLKEHIGPDDVILNVTDSADLVIDGLVFSDFQLYFKQFFQNHKMSHLCERKGRIGVWAILKEPIKLEKGFPFFFPKGYFPQLVKHYNHFAIYYGQMEMSESNGLELRAEFSTPFWSFMKARCLQRKVKFEEAESYYKWMIGKGLNIHRALYNLSLMYSFVNIDFAIQSLQKAIELLETPTAVPVGAKTEQINIVFNTEKSLATLKEKGTGPRFFIVKKEGIAYKKWFLEDIIRKYPNYYSEYYISMGKLLYVKYVRSKDSSWLKGASFYFSKGFQLNPNYDQKNKILKLLETKSLKLDPKFLVFRVQHLKGVSEEFPRVFY